MLETIVIHQKIKEPRAWETSWHGVLTYRGFQFNEHNYGFGSHGLWATESQRSSAGWREGNPVCESWKFLRNVWKQGLLMINWLGNLYTSEMNKYCYCSIKYPFQPSSIHSLISWLFLYQKKRFKTVWSRTIYFFSFIEVDLWIRQCVQLILKTPQCCIKATELIIVWLRVWLSRKGRATVIIHDQMSGSVRVITYLLFNYFYIRKRNCCWMSMTVYLYFTNNNSCT